MFVLVWRLQFCNSWAVSMLASDERLSVTIPDLANRPRQLVFLTPIDSRLNDFLHEIHQIVRLEPGIVERIDEDLVTALATGAFGLPATAWHVLIARAAAWQGRGVRTPVRKALLAAAVDPSIYGRAFGFERAMDTLGAIIGPLTALGLLAALPGNYRTASGKLWKRSKPQLRREDDRISG
jgi:hypothetical protein